MDRLKDLLIEYRGDEEGLTKDAKQTADLFMFNQWVLNEYPGGLSSMLVEESLEEMIEQIEITLGMGLAVLTALLETVRLQLGTS